MKKLKVLFAALMVAGTLFNTAPAHAGCANPVALKACYSDCSALFAYPLDQACRLGCWIACTHGGAA